MIPGPGTKIRLAAEHSTAKKENEKKKNQKHTYKMQEYAVSLLRIYSHSQTPV